MRRAVWVVVGVSAVLGLALWRPPIGAWATALAEAARDAGPVGVAIFVAAYVVGTVAVLPGSALTLAAGFAYGPVWGLVLASPASLLAATAAFVLGRTLLRRWAMQQVSRFPVAKALDGALGSESFKMVMLLRLSPLFPFAVMNYLLSISSVSLRAYVGASFIGMLPGTAMYVYLGSLIPTAAAVSAGAPTSRLELVLYVAGLLATVVAAAVATRAARKGLAAAHLAASADTLREQ